MFVFDIYGDFIVFNITFTFNTFKSLIYFNIITDDGLLY